jgi:hypothetical protein
MSVELEGGGYEPQCESGGDECEDDGALDGCDCGGCEEAEEREYVPDVHGVLLPDLGVRQ